MYSAQLEGTPYYSQVTSGSVQKCGNAARDRHTDGRDQYTFRLGYASHEM